VLTAARNSAAVGNVVTSMSRSTSRCAWVVQGQSSSFLAELGILGVPTGGFAIGPFGNYSPNL
jgi:hypothetical protein